MRLMRTRMSTNTKRKKQTNNKEYPTFVGCENKSKARRAHNVHINDKPAK